MIHIILQVIKNDLGEFLRNRLEERDNVVVLSGLMNNADGSFAVGLENKLICSLLNIEQERINLNAPTGGNVLVNPPFNLNLYVLLAAYSPPTSYERALKTLSLTIAYFQGKQVFTPANTPGLPPGVEKMVVELVNVDLKDLSNFWTALGAKQLPAVVIKIRMISITADIVMEEVTPIIGIDTQITQD